MTPVLTETIDWTKPGPGTWELDSGHFDPSCSRIARDNMASAMNIGMRQGFELMGGPLASVDCAFVNGRFYRRLVPLVGANKDLPPPPAAAMWLATRLIPAFRKGTRKAKRAIDDRIWRAEFDRWNAEWRPSLTQRSAELTAVDPSSLTDNALADHLEAALDHLHTGTILHFRLHASDLGPIGLLLVRSREWGLDDAEVMMAMSGSSPATSAPGIELAELGRLVAEAGVTPNSLDELRQISPEVEARLAAFLDRYGCRLTTGYDLRDVTLGELPGTILASVTGSQTVGPATGDDAKRLGDSAFDRLRSQVPANDAAELEQLVTDARDLYGLRDDNGPITYEWPAGIVRRALLEVGRRLDGRSLLPADDLGAVFELSRSEVLESLRSNIVPSLADIEQRIQTRDLWCAAEAPAFLGPEPVEPPLSVLPGPMAVVMRAVLTVMELLETEAKAEGELVGVGIGQATYRGRACVVSDAGEALARLKPGDVLVAPYTVPTYNSVLAMAGAVVVDAGGLLSHAAVIAREYGLPAVVGTGRATAVIPDGAEIEVDPVAGRVRIVSQPVPD